MWNPLVVTNFFPTWIWFAIRCFALNTSNLISFPFTWFTLVILEICATPKNIMIVVFYNYLGNHLINVRWTQNIWQKRSLRVCFISRGTNKQSIGPANSVDEFHNILFFSKFFRYIISMTLDAVLSCIQNHGCIIWEQRNITICNIISIQFTFKLEWEYLLTH